MERIAGDSKPMTGVWYQSTIQPWVQGKVTEKDANMVTVVATGGVLDRCTMREFADSWELS